MVWIGGNTERERGGREETVEITIEPRKDFGYLMDSRVAAGGVQPIS